MTAEGDAVLYRHQAPAPILFVMGAAAAVLIFLTPGSALRTALIVFLLVAAPAAAALANAFAARAMPATLRAPWLIFAAAGLAGVASQTDMSAGAAGLDSWHALLYVAAMVLFAIGTGWILHQRDSGRVLEIALDAGLAVSAVCVVTLRWSPAARAVLDDASAATFTTVLAVFGAPIATGCAFLFATVLLLVRGGSRGGAAAGAIAVGAAALGVATSPLALGQGSCCGTADAAAVGFIIGWLGVAYAGVRVALGGADVYASSSADPVGHRLRMVVAPAVALVIGATVVDAAWRGGLEEATALTIGVLGLLLALRVSQLLFATRSQSTERLQLAQSRALIEVSQALAGMTRLQDTLDLVTQWAARLLLARSAIIELLTPDGTELEFHSVHGLSDEAVGLRFPVEDSFTGWIVRNGVARSTADARQDPFIRRDVLPIIGGSAVAGAPLRYRGQTLGVLSCIGSAPFTQADLELLGALAEQAAVAIENARLFEQVHQLSMTDPLTGLPNRRQLERDLRREFAAARRGRHLVAIMFDLNGFKAYNDRHGHLAGDEALCLFAAALTTETRAMNMAARYGGDEFIALLADAGPDGATTFIERVRLRFPGADANPDQARLTVAAGFAEYDPSMEGPEELVRAADRALYGAKKIYNGGSS